MPDRYSPSYGGDFLCLDQAGRISAAYPFSATATPHTIQITSGTSAYAMCAIDALGMAEMLHTSHSLNRRGLERAPRDPGGPERPAPWKSQNRFSGLSAYPVRTRPGTGRACE